MHDDNELLLLKSEFHSFKEHTEHEIEELKKTIRYQDNRLKDVEMSKQKTDFQYEQIMKTLEKLTDETIPNLTAQIQELRDKPVKRYDQAITAILGAIFGIIGTTIANLFIKK